MNGTRSDETNSKDNKTMIEYEKKTKANETKLINNKESYIGN